MPSLTCLATVAVMASMIYDGDTVSRQGTDNVRLTGAGNAPFDTPEIGQNAGCRRELAQGIAARDMVRSLMPGTVCVIGRGNGGYGRDLGVLIGRDGREVRDHLFAAGLAVPAKTHDWCGS